MTTIVGIVSLDGIVMASDLIGIRENGKRGQTRKLYYSSNVIMGHTGIGRGGSRQELSQFLWLGILIVGIQIYLAVWK